MKYWKVNYYTAEGEFETKSFIITDEQHNQIRQAMDRQVEFIGIEGKPTIKRTLIATIIDANNEVAEYQRQGIKVDGLLEPTEKPKEITGNVKKVSDFLKETRKQFFERMGWRREKEN